MKNSFVKRFLITCNPWFLASTLLLLLGIYLIYVDPKLIGKDNLQMYMSFTSLQFYELLCAGVIFLFRRMKLFYDSVFLIVIISLLLFVPFITFNQALQYDDSLLEKLGYMSLILACVKMSAVKVYFKGINIPWMILFCGLAMLLMNFSIPFVMRGLNVEDDSSGIVFMGDVFSIMVPIIGLFGYLAMYKIKDGKEIFENKWLPVTVFQCFFTVTLINLTSIMYVYDIDQKVFYYAITLLISGFLTLHPVIGLNRISKQSILAGMLILVILTLGSEYKLHFSLALGLIMLFSLSVNDKWIGLSSFVLLALTGVDLIPGIGMNYLQLCLIAALILVSWYAVENPEWSSLILPGILMIFVLKLYHVREEATLIFWSMTLALHIATFWNSEKYKKDLSIIASISVLWVICGFFAHVDSGWPHSLGLGLSLFSIQLIRKYVFKEFQPAYLLVITAVVVVLWPLEELLKILRQQSFSMIVIIISFMVFTAGTIATCSKRVRETQSFE